MAGAEDKARLAAAMELLAHRYWTFEVVAVVVFRVNVWHITGSHRKHSIELSACLEVERDSSGGEQDFRERSWQGRVHTEQAW